MRIFPLRRWRALAWSLRSLPALLAASLLTLLPATGQAAPLYTVTPLPANFSPSDINNAGQIAGALTAGSGGPHAALYADGAVSDLGTFGGTYSYATALNDSGAITGNFGNADGTAAGEHAFVYQHGRMDDIGPANAMGINAAGAVVGQLRQGDQMTGFVYRQGAVHEIGHLGQGDVSLAAAINDAGIIVGESNMDAGTQVPTHPYLYENGTLHDLGTLADTGVSSAVAINNAGQIAGYSDAGSGRTHVFLYEQGTLFDLGSFGGFDVTIGGMNGQGWFVGTGNTPDGPDVAFLARDHALIDLNTLVDPAAGWRVTSAIDINDHNQIVANACRADTCFAVLLNPVDAVPESAHGALLLSGMALLFVAGKIART